IVARADEGLPKLWVTRQALALRRRIPGTFGPDGAYLPLRAEGPRRDHVVAFARGDGCIAVAPRLPLRLDGRWGDTTLTLPGERWHNELTGEAVAGGPLRLAVLLKRFPVALLARADRTHEDG